MDSVFKPRNLTSELELLTTFYLTPLNRWDRESNGTPLQYSCLENPMDGEPGRLQSMGSLSVGHDWATSLSFFTFMHWRGNGNPLQCSCLENPRDGGAWWAAVYGVAQSWTRLKWRRSSSSSSNRWENWQWSYLPNNKRQVSDRAKISTQVCQTLNASFLYQSKESDYYWS